MCACLCGCVRACVRARVCVCVHTRACVRVSVRACVRACAYAYMCFDRRWGEGDKRCDENLFVRSTCFVVSVVSGQVIGSGVRGCG